MKNTILFLTMLIFSLGSCIIKKTASDIINTTKMQIMDTSWELTKYDGELIDKSDVNIKVINFSLNSTDSTVSGYSGCNTFTGTFSIEPGNRIRFSQLASTRMACPDAEIEESKIFEVFELANNYTFNDGVLALNIGRRAPLAEFKKATSSELIVEKYWKLIVLEGQKVTMEAIQEREVYFMLKTDENRVSGFAGCNALLGTYTLEDGNRIKFSNMATTAMACPELKLKESKFLKIFELADNYSISGNVLSLNVGRRAPLAIFEVVYF